MMYVEFLKNIFSPIRANWWVFESFRPPEPKNVWLLLSKSDVVVFMKNFFSPIRAIWWALESFRSPAPKNVWLLLSRHDVHRVHEKFFSLRFERTDGCYSHFGLLSPKTFDSHFLDMMYVAFMKNFLSLIRANWWALESFRPLSIKTFNCCIVDMMYVAFMKNFFSPIGANWWALDLFRPPEPENVWFPLSRNDVRQVHEKFFLPDSSELMAVRVISASWV